MEQCGFVFHDADMAFPEDKITALEITSLNLGTQALGLHVGIAGCSPASHHHRQLDKRRTIKTKCRFAAPEIGRSEIPFGYGAGIPYDARTRVWGIYADALPATGFAPIAVSLMPAPWSDPALPLADLGNVLYAQWPVWRRYVALEAQNPATTEMDVRGMACAASITGMLLGPGWTPSAALRARRPRTDDELRQSWWALP